MKFDKYNTELINGTKGTICIPVGAKFTDILKGSEFLKDVHTDSYIRSNAIVRFEYVGTTSYIEVN